MDAAVPLVTRHDEYPAPYTCWAPPISPPAYPFPLVWSELLPKPFVPPFVHSVLLVSSSLSLHLMTLTRTIYAFFSPSSLIFSLGCCLCSWDPKFSNGATLRGKNMQKFKCQGVHLPGVCWNCCLWLWAFRTEFFQCKINSHLLVINGVYTDSCHFSITLI